MPQPPQDYVLNAFIFGTFLLSILTGAYLLRVYRREPLLPYEPRRPVPWNAAACLLALLTVFSAIVSTQGVKTPVETETTIEVAANVGDLVFQLLTTVFIVGGFLTVVALLSNANRSDLGLPASFRVFGRDIAIGAVACLASLAPVLIVQTVLKLVFFLNDKSSGHPLIKMMMSGEPDFGLLALAGLFAVVVAPVCEEITFRLLLQGWLEKLEDARVRARTDQAELAPEIIEAQAIVDEESPADTLPVDGGSKVVDDRPLQQEPPAQGMFGLPHGWFPILASASLFGLAHFGYGPEPVPLILLAVVLGYLYQRTHRILPGIVTHALFNLFSILILWRMIFHPA